MSGVIAIQPLKRAHRIFEARHAAMVDAVLNSAGAEGLKASEANPGFRSRTGDLLAASTHRVIKSGSGRLLRLRNTKKYAAAIDKGARPHRITARNAPYLVFYWHKIGRWMRIKSVNHPGNRPYRFLWRGFQKSKRHALTQLKAGMRTEGARFGSR